MTRLGGVLPVPSSSGVRRRPQVAPAPAVRSEAGSAIPDQQADDWFESALSSGAESPAPAATGVPDLLTAAIGDLQLVQRVETALNAMNSAGVSAARVAVALGELGSSLTAGATTKEEDVSAFEATAAREIAALSGPPPEPPPEVPTVPAPTVPAPVPAPTEPPFWTPLRVGLAATGGTLTVGAIVAAIVYFSNRDKR